MFEYPYDNVEGFLNIPFQAIVPDIKPALNLYTFSSTDLPEGLTLSNNGTISGTPTKLYDKLVVTISVTYQTTLTAKISFRINPPEIESPSCKFDSSIQFRVGLAQTVIPMCNSIVINTEISPNSLPVEIKLFPNGILTTNGLRYEYEDYTYSFTFTFNDQSKYTTKTTIKVIKELHCYYSIINPVYISPIMPITFKKPICTTPMFTIVIKDGYLPPGLTLDSDAGTIKGKVSNYITEECRVTFIIGDISNSVFETINLNIIVVNPHDFKGITMRVGPENVGNTFAVEPSYSLFNDGTWNSGVRIIDRLQYNGMEIPDTAFRYEEDYVLFSALFEAEVEGTYMFSTNYDDSSALFFDDMTEPKVITEWWYEYKTYTVQLKPGYYPIRILGFAQSGEQSVMATYKGPNDIDFSVISKDGPFYADIQPLQDFKYESDVIQVGFDKKLKITPITIGTLNEYSYEPASLDNELTEMANFHYFGTTGLYSKDTSENNRKLLTVKVTAKLGSIITVTASYALSFVAFNYATLARMMADYYFIDNKDCDDITVDYINSLTPTMRKAVILDSTVFFQTTKLPKELTREYFGSWAVRYYTMLNSKDSNIYFNVETSGGAAIDVGGNMILKKNSCSSEIVSKSALFDNPNFANTYFYMWKGKDQDTFNYTLTQYSNNNGLTPNNYFTNCYINLVPEAYYTYSVVEYEQGVEIVENPIVIYPDGWLHKFTTFTSDPPLPSGLSFGNKGTIKGTPTEVIGSPVVFKITAKGSDSHIILTLKMRIIPALEAFTFSYPEVSLKMGEEIYEVKPTVSNPSIVFSFDFDSVPPIGLTINHETGVISGSPRQSISGTIRIRCVTYARTYTTEWKLNLEGCKPTEILAKITYYSYDGLFKVKVIESSDITSTSEVIYENEEHQQNKQYDYVICAVKTSNYLLQITNNGLKGPDYQIYFDTILYTKGQMIFGNNYIEIPFSVPNTNNKPTIIYLNGVVDSFINSNFYSSPYAIDGVSSYTLKYPSFLPSTVSFDTNTGEISGYVDTLGDLKLKITGSNSKGESEVTTVIIRVSDKCKDNRDVFYTIKFETTNSNSFLSFELEYENEDVYGVMILDDAKTKYYSFCKPHGLFTSTLKRSDAGGTDTTNIEIKGDNRVISTYSFDPNRLQQVDNIRYPQILYSSNEEYYYSMNYENNWNIEFQDDDSWTKSDVSSLPQTSSTKVLYIRKFLYYDSFHTDRPHVKGIITYQSGIVVYVNGEQIYRRNMPDITASTSSLSTTDAYQSFASPKQYTFLVSPRAFNSKYVYIGIELHSESSSTTIGQFKLDLLFSNSDEGGEMFKDYSKLQCGRSDSAETTCVVADFNANNDFIANTLPVSFIVGYTDNFASFIDTYQIYQGFNVRNNFKSWIVYGVTDNNGNNINTDYKILIHEMIDSGLNAVSSFSYDFYPNTELAFEAYLFTITEAYNAGESSISEFFPEYKSGSFCPSTGIFPRCGTGKVSYISCDKGYSGVKGKYCDSETRWNSDVIDRCEEIEFREFMYSPLSVKFFKNHYGNTKPSIEQQNAIRFYSVDKELPLGLSLNTATGEISGIPYEVKSKTYYTVTATLYNSYYSSNTYSTSVYIEVAETLCIDSTTYEPTTTCAASSVEYNNGNALIFYTQQSVEYMPTKMDGYVTRWTMNNVITGITIDEYSGKISGKTTGNDRTGNLIVGFDSNSLTIPFKVINNIMCNDESDGLGSAAIGETKTKDCEEYYEGYNSKTCIFEDNNPVWKWNSKCLLKYPTITYPSNYKTFYLNKDIGVVSPIIYSKSFSKCQIIPFFTLFDANTCKFKGIPTDTYERQTYKVKVLNDRGWSNETTISIGVYNYLPTPFIYPNNIKFIRNIYNSYLPEYPQESGNNVIIPYTNYKVISNNLPNGMAINSDSGELSGKLSFDSDKDIIITIEAGIDSNSNNNIRVDAYIQLIFYECKDENDGMGKAAPNELITKVCESGYEGMNMKLCNFVNNDVKWEWKSKCKLSLPTIQYPKKYVTFYINTEIEKLQPIVSQSNGILEYKISPNLPSLFNSENGVISGKTSALMERQEFRIQVRNVVGWGKAFVISIAVYDNTPTTLDYDVKILYYNHNIKRDVITIPQYKSYAFESMSISSLKIDKDNGTIYGNVPTGTTSPLDIKIICKYNDQTVTQTVRFEILNFIEVPSCSYTYPLVYQINAQISASPTCTMRITSITDISPSLLPSLSINSNGVISGTIPFEANDLQYTITAQTVDKRHLSFLASFIIFDTLTSCSYGQSKFYIPESVYFTILPPQCNSYYSSATISSGSLPNGLRINGKTGSISGVCSLSSGSGSFTVRLSNSRSNKDVVVNYEITNSLVDGVSVQLSYESSDILNNNPNEIMERFNNMEYDFYTKISDEVNYKCESSNECEFTNNQINQVLGKWNTMINELAEIRRTFTLNANDKAFLYIDDMSNYKLESKFNEAATVDIVLSAGKHQIVVLSYNKYSSQYLLLMNDDVIMSNTITPNLLRTYPPPIQYIQLDDGNNDNNDNNNMLLFQTNIFSSYKLKLYGYVKSFEWNNKPNGIDIDKYGVISGKPTTPLAFTTYTIKAKGEGLLELSFDVSVVITDSSGNNNLYLKGLYSNYYVVSIGSECKIPGYTESLIEKIDLSVIHNNNELIWDDLTNSFDNEFYVKWEGYLYNSKNSDYYFIIKSNSFCELTIENQRYISECGYRTTTTGIVLLHEGYNRIVISYFKKRDSIQPPHIEIEYIEISNPTITYSIDNNIYYIPKTTFEYKYRKIEYVRNQVISKNCPVYYQVDKTIYTRYSSKPSLPSGLLFDSNGCIYGTPTSISSNIVHTITVTDNANTVKLITTVTIEIKTMIAPSNLNYPSVPVGYLGEEYSIIPTYTSGDGKVKFSIDSASNPLPLGLKLNAETGEISGTPLNQVSNQNIIVKCSNAGGSVSYTVKITINGCRNNGYLYDIEYRGSSQSLIVAVEDSNSNIIYYKDKHDMDEEYKVSRCSPTSIIKVTIRNNKQRYGYYRIGTVNDYLLDYGEYDKTAIVKSINLAASGRPSISYSSSSFTFVKTETIYIIPKTITNSIVTISSSALPNGLSINPRNGVISGVLNSKGNYPITITCQNSAGTTNVQITITVIEQCSKGYALAGFRVIGGDNGSSIKFQIEDNENKMLIYYEGFYSYELFGLTKCFIAGDYNLVMSSIAQSGWGDNSYLLIDGERKERKVYQILKNERTIITDILSLDTTAINEDTGWEISDKFEPNWYNNVNTGWKRHKLINLPSRSGITRYYRTYTRDYESLGNLIDAVVDIKYDSGLIIYLNGKVIYTKNFASSTSITPTTYSSRLVDISIHKIYLSNNWIKNDFNIIGIETHMNEKSSFVDPLYFVLKYEKDSSINFNYGLLLPSEYSSSDLFSSVDDSFFDEFHKCIDRNKETQLVYTTTDSEIEMKFNFPNEMAKPIENYEFITGSNCPSSDPTSWEVYGIKDNGVIEVLDTKTSYSTTTNRKTSMKFNINKDPYLYNGFGIKFKGFRGPDTAGCGKLQLSEVNYYLYSSSVCENDNNWPITRVGDEITIDCDEGFTGSQNRKCNSVGSWSSITRSCNAKAYSSSLSYESNAFTFYKNVQITPKYPNVNGIVDSYSISPEESLPVGLMFSKKNGVISGIPLATTSSAISFTIASYKTSSKIVLLTTTVSISVKTATCSNPTMELNGVEYKSCNDGYSGKQSRVCTVISDSIKWSEWDNSQCKLGQSPECYYTEEISIIKGKDVNINPTCKVTPEKVIITPSLPGNLVYDSNTGVISGKAMVLHPITKYHVLFMKGENGYNEQEFTLRVVETLTYCNYPFDNNKIRLNLNLPIELLPPKCNTEFEKITIKSGTLPKGISLDEKTGKIYGIPTELNGIGTTIIFEATNSAGSVVSFNLKIFVKDFVVNRLQGIYSPSNSYPNRISSYSPYWHDLSSGLILSEKGYSPEHLCDFTYSDNIMFPENIKRIKHYLAIWKGYIKIDVPGYYLFYVTSNSDLWMFINDMDIPVVYSDNHVKNQTDIYLSEGYHKFGILYYVEHGIEDYENEGENNEGENNDGESESENESLDEGNENKIKIRWENVDAGIISPNSNEGVGIPDSLFYYFNEPIQQLVYERYQYIFYVGFMSNITPLLLIGTPERCTISPNLPYGMVIDNSCIISGIPLEDKKSTKYTVVAENQLSSIEVSFNIEVVNNKDHEYFKEGLVFEIFKNDDNVMLKQYRELPFYFNKIEGIYLEYSKIDYYKYHGFIHITAFGEYLLSLTSTIDSILKINNKVVLSLNSNENKNSIVLPLKNGYHLVDIISYNRNDGRIPFISLDLSCNNKNVEIDNKFYHLPPNLFYYDYEIVGLVSQVKIKPIKPIISYSLEKYDDLIFSIEPALPDGLSFDTLTGVISGTPTITYLSLTEYNVILYSRKMNTDLYVKTKIMIGIEKFILPPDFTYPPISIQIGTNVHHKFKPTIIDNSNTDSSNYYFYIVPELPIPFSFNSINGVIEGMGYKSYFRQHNVICVNPSGTKSIPFQFEIDGCSEGMSLIRLSLIPGNSGSVKFEVKSSISKSPLLTLPSSFIPFSITKCLKNDGIFTFKLSSNSLHGGYYVVQADHNLIRYNKYEDGNVNFLESYEIYNDKPVVVYDKESYVVTLRIPLFVCPTVKNSASYFVFESDFIPNGFVFYNETGCIAIQTLIDFISTKINVKAVNDYGWSDTVSLTFTASTCSKEGVLRVRINSGKSGNTMIIKIQDSNGNELVNYEGVYNDDEDWKGFCTDSKKFYVDIGSTINNEWDKRSRLTIYYNDDVLLHQRLDIYTQSKTYSLIVPEVLIGKESLWQYSQYRPVDGWNMNFGELNWDRYFTDLFPLRRVNIHKYYYRKSFKALGELSQIQYLKCEIRYDCPFILYINDNEVYRRYISLEGKATQKCVYNPKTIVVEIISSLLISGTNTISVVVNTDQSAMLKDPFRVVLTSIYWSGGTNSVIQTYLYSPSNFDNMIASSTHTSNNANDVLTNAYDDDLDTKYYISDLNINNEPLVITFTWYNKICGFNSWVYGIASSNKERDAISFKLYGAYDQKNPEWFELEHAQSFIPDSVERKSKYSYDIYTKKSVEIYKYELISVRGADTSGFQAAELLAVNQYKLGCPADEEWPETFQSNTVTLSCKKGYAGYRTRRCSKIGSWENVISHCEIPGTISHYQSDILYFYYDEIVSYSPIADGGFDYYDVSCILPNGIVLFTNNGTISGYIQQEAPQIVTECNLISTHSNAIVTFSFTIVIQTLFCPTVGQFNSVKTGSFSYADCDYGYSGKRRMLCYYGYPPKWREEDDSGCILLKPTIEYQHNVILLKQNEEINPIIPKIENIVKSITVSSNLPLGLSVNRENGIITGRPTTLADDVKVSITISNEAGSNTLTLSISVVLSFATSIDYTNKEFSFSIGVENEASEAIKINGGKIQYLSINPPLQPGLDFNEINGVISGIPNKDITINQQTHIITGYYPGGSIKSSQITVKYVKLKCSSLDNNDYPETEVGKKYVNDCKSPLIGIRYRECLLQSPPKWSEEISNCHQLHPVRFEYEKNQMYCYIGVYCELKPYYEGNIDQANFAVTKGSLLNGLKIYKNGTISGIVNTKTQTSITIQAVEDTTKTFDLTIISDYQKCPEDLGFPQTQVGLTASVNCGIGNSAIKKRKCLMNENIYQPELGKWDKIDSSACGEYYPIIELYNDLICYVGIDCESTLPVIRGIINSYEIRENLPNGLSIDKNTGLISGKPTEVSYEKYTLTGSSNYGSSTIVIYIIIHQHIIYGLTGTYYQLDSSICDTESMPNYENYKIKTIRVDENINFKMNDENAWKGISPSLNEYIGVVWNTNIYLACSGEWIFGLESASGSTLTLVTDDTLIVDNSGCHVNKYKDGNTARAKGFYEMKIEYYSLIGDRGIALTYQNKLCEPTPQIAPKTLFSNEIDDLSYTYQLNYYAVNVLIEPNKPLFKRTDGLIKYYVSPSLPKGFELNETSGVITGTPTEIQELKTYTIYGIDKFNRGFDCSIQIGVEELPHPTLIGFKVDNYEENEIAVSLYSEIPPIEPIYKNSVSYFTIEPELPLGLYLDNLTGVIRGKPTVYFPKADYTLTMFNRVGNSSRQFSLAVDTCRSPKFYVIIEHQTGKTNAKSEKYKLVNKDTNEEYTSDYKEKNHLYTDYYCVIEGHYEIILEGESKGWNNPIYIKYESGIIENSFNLFKDEETYSFTLSNIVTPGDKISYYTDSQNEPNDDWLDLNYDKTKWEEGTFYSFPQLTNRKMYFKKEFRLIGILGYNSLHLSFKYEEGIKVYMNSVEVWRDRINNNDIITGERGVKFTGVDLLISHNINDGLNCIGVILYREKSINSYLQFDMQVTVSEGLSSLIQDVKCNSSIENDNANPNNLVDNNPYSSYNLQGYNKVKIYCYFPRSAYMNKMIISTAKLNEDAPSNWVIYGKNYTTTKYTVIDQEEKYVYESIDSTITLSSINTYFNEILFDVIDTTNSDPIIHLTALQFVMSLWDICLPDEDGWIETKRGTKCVIPCAPGYIGTRYRDCEDSLNPYWGEADEADCKPGSTYAISYNPSNVDLFVDEEVHIPPPTVKGYADSFSIKPYLPDGLVFNTLSGEITGKPKASMRWQWFNVTAGNSKYKVNGKIEIVFTYLYIQIKDIACEKTNEWPRTMVGSKALIQCGVDYSGFQKRECINNEVSNKPEWSEIDRSDCEALPPMNLTYESPIILYRNVTMNETKPTVINSIRKYYITPNLPSGVLFDPLYGSILGTPLIPYPNTTYSVIGVNTIGSVNTSFTLRVDLIECKAEGVWNYTERGTYAIVHCNSGYAGYQKRKCGNKDDITPIWNEIDRSDCQSLSSNPARGKINLNFRVVLSPIIIGSVYDHQSEMSLRKILSENLNMELNEILIAKADLYGDTLTISIRFIMNDKYNVSNVLEDNPYNYLISEEFKDKLTHTNILYESIEKMEVSFVDVQYHKDKKGLHPGIIALIVIIVLLVIAVAVGIAIKIYLVKKAFKEDKMDDLDEVE